MKNKENKEDKAMTGRITIVARQRKTSQVFVPRMSPLRLVCCPYLFVFRYLSTHEHSHSMKYICDRNGFLILLSSLESVAQNPLSNKQPRYAGEISCWYLRRLLIYHRSGLVLISLKQMTFALTIL